VHAGAASGDRPRSPLIRPRPRTSAPIDWTKIGDDTLIEAIRRIGIDRALNAVIVADETSA